MRTAVCLALAAALVGCATYSERLAQEPWVSFDSAKDERAISGCAAPQLREMFPSLIALPDGDSTVYSASAGVQQISLLAITLTPSEMGTRVQMRSFAETGNFRRAAEILRACG